MELPSDLTEGASLRGHEYAWPLDAVPAVLAKAQLLGLGCLGGQFQFRTPDSICEMYWLNADSVDRSLDEPWDRYVTRSCSEVLSAFTALASSTNFHFEASRWSAVPELSGLGATPEQYLCFVADFMEESPAPNNSFKPKPLRGSA
jgi:hypothetical protein